MKQRKPEDLEMALRFLAANRAARARALPIARRLEEAAVVREAQSTLRRWGWLHQLVYVMTEEWLPFVAVGVIVGLPTITALLGDTQQALTMARVAVLILGPAEALRQLG